MSSIGGGRVQSIAYNQMTWTDIVDPSAAEVDTLGREHNLHPLDLEECLSGKVTKVEDHGDHMFLLMHFPEEDDKGVITPNRVSIFLGKNYLVTLHPGTLEPVLQIFEACKKDEGKRASFMRSPPYLAYRIIDTILACIFAILDKVQGELDDIEAVVFAEKESQVVPINRARRQIAVLGRIVSPLTLYLPELSKAQKFSGEDLTIYFDDISHEVRRSSGTVEEMKEMLEIYKDTDFVTSTNRTNNVLSILTILFTLTIPATLLSSVYGMNIPLPGGLVTGPLDFAGPYSTFLVIVVLMLIPAFAMAWYFRRAGWF